MRLGMRSFQAQQVHANPSSSDMSFDISVFLIDSCQAQTYLFHVQDFLKGSKVADNDQFYTELACLEDFAYRGRLTSKEDIQREDSNAVSFVVCGF